MATIIHVRLRESDGDITAWYERQADKSRYIRGLVREDMEQARGGGNSVGETVARAMDALPEIVRSAATAAVREALSSCQLAPIPDRATGEDPELAARLDEQLGDFFSDEE